MDDCNKTEEKDEPSVATADMADIDIDLADIDIDLADIDIDLADNVSDLASQDKISMESLTAISGPAAPPIPPANPPSPFSSDRNPPSHSFLSSAEESTIRDSQDPKVESSQCNNRASCELSRPSSEESNQAELDGSDQEDKKTSEPLQEEDSSTSAKPPLPLPEVIFGCS